MLPAKVSDDCQLEHQPQGGRTQLCVPHDLHGGERGECCAGGKSGQVGAEQRRGRQVQEDSLQEERKEEKSKVQASLEHL